MDWLTEHFDVLLPVALVLFFIFQRFFVQDEGNAGQGPGGGDSESDREARRIQEEIRRKIVARQQGRFEEVPGGGEEPFPAEIEREAVPPPIRLDRGRTISASPVPPPLRQAETFRPTVARRDIQAELRVQRERLKDARRAKADAVRRTSEAGLIRHESAYSDQAQAERSLRAQLLSDLSTSHSLKRAFLLKEVVDRPIGLRTGSDSYSNWV
jgi:hypothetical protein